MQDSYKTFEFEKVLENVKSEAQTSSGALKIMGLRMFEEEEELKKELSFLKEGLSIIPLMGYWPLTASRPLREPLSLAGKGGSLRPLDFLDIASDLRIGNGLKAYFKKVQLENSLLRDRVSLLPELGFLLKDIEKAIGPDLAILDTASTRLKGLRMGIRKAEKDIRLLIERLSGLYAPYLSSERLVTRNGHLALPVLTAHKSKVKGLIQGVSQTGGTIFIEPEPLLIMNSKLEGLLEEEKEEIRLILESLSRTVGEHEGELLFLNEEIAYFDVLLSKCKYAEKRKGQVATIAKEPTIELLEARHPLIDPELVVPNDFDLKGNGQLVVISGPNAGGKTVALKTVGLAIMMIQAGLPVLAKEGAMISFFRHVYADIGDSQSISDNLSTFSAHMRNIGEILALAGGKDLVLLDEVGTGTAPEEGEALAEAIVDAFLRKRVLGFVSSHFEGLKEHALEKEGIVNASMAFDEERLAPTYHLRMGLPGESYGLMVARRFGIEEGIVTRAQEILGSKKEVSVSLAIRKLEEATSRAEKKEKELKEQLDKALRLEKNLKSKEKTILMKERAYQDDLERAKKEELRKYEDKLKGLLDQALSTERKPHEIIAVKKKMRDLSEEEAQEETFREPLKIGDYVEIPSLFVTGRLNKITGSTGEVITEEGINVKARLERMRSALEPERKEEKAKPMSGLTADLLANRKSLGLELNLIGQRVEEAKLNLDKYLDECRVRNLKRVRIIHGFGSGALRNMVKGYCENNRSWIDRYELAAGNEGGGGATIVYLK